MSSYETSTRLAELWTATDRLLEGATLEDVVVHHLGPLAATRLRRRGAPVPEPLVREERAAALSMLTGIPLVQRVRESCDGPLVLIKGPEIARLYPDNARRFGDIDLLTATADAVHRSLLANGFLEVDDPDLALHPEHHHLHPLRWPSIWLKVEVHTAPNWPLRAPRAPLEEILEARIPSSLGVEGVCAPTPLHHALVLAAHAWRHEPLQALRDLLDVAVVSAPVPERELERTADAWGIGRLWRTTWHAIEAVIYGGPRTVPLRTWARHLTSVRERSVLERHLQLLLHAYWELPPHLASAQAARALGRALGPTPGETWRAKLTRARSAVRNPRAPVTGRDSRLRLRSRRGRPGD
jgi:putative nucleotidyltransferase-like protein